MQVVTDRSRTLRGANLLIRNEGKGLRGVEGMLDSSRVILGMGAQRVVREVDGSMEVERLRD